MSTTSLRRCCLSSYLRSHFPPSRSSLVFAFRRSRLSVAQLNPRTDFVTLYISCGPLRFTIPSSSPSKYSTLARLGQRHHQGYGRTVKYKLMLTTGTTADFISVKNFQKSCHFWKSPFGWQTILLVWQNTYRQLNVVFLQRS